jgi:beta-lactamase class A
MIAYRGPSRRTKKSRKGLLLVLAVALILLAAGAAFFVLRPDQKPRSSESVPANHTGDTPPQQEQEPPKPLVELQPVVDAWVAKQSATYSIVVYDPANKQVIASNKPDTKLFAASLYKLYVAYLSLMDFQSGAQKPDEILTQGFTRRECVDKMIRESYSPCGEAMMADIGQETLRQRVAAMGIKNTIFAGITTTAEDSALMLQYIVEGRDLNTENTEFLKDAMRVQDAKFRGGLPKGAPKATWETKVGWNQQYNYHDVGIMTLPGGRQYIVAILSQGNGSSAPIANFAATIYAALTK